jgi:protein-disulfide isomerase
MSRDRHRLLRALAVGVAVSVAAAACARNTTGPSAAGTGPAAQLPALDAMLADKVMGNAAAGVTMIEYSSLTCPHCASFHSATLPQIKAAYIDPGKVKLVYRDYPLDSTAMSAAMVARCSGDRYFTVLDLLFQTQASWAGSSNPTSAIKAVVAQAGMTGADVDACLGLSDLRTSLTNMKTVGQQQYGVGGTPTFIIGSQTIAGAYPFATFDAVLKPLTQ